MLLVEAPYIALLSSVLRTIQTKTLRTKYATELPFHDSRRRHGWQFRRSTGMYQEIRLLVCMPTGNKLQM